MTRLSVIVLLLSCSLAAADKAPDKKPASKQVTQGRLYFKLLFDSKAPPFASKKQPLYVEIDDDAKPCRSLKKAKVTADAAGKKLKACAVELRDRFPLDADQIYLEEQAYEDFIKRWDKKAAPRIRAATKDMMIVEGAIPGDGESLQFWFGLNPEYSIRAIFVETDAAE